MTKNPKKQLPSNQLVFGRTFTDHSMLRSNLSMSIHSILIDLSCETVLTIPWNSETGWGAPKIQPYGPLSLDPSSTVLHYAPTLFEGMKAYKSKDGVARLFRPDKVRFESMNLDERVLIHSS